MNEVILEMLSGYTCVDSQDHNNAFREVIQKLSLLALSRAEFFEHTALYGDCSLRILFNLQRFVKGLDFSLVKPGLDFDWNVYQDALMSELKQYGLTVSFTPAPKSAQSVHKSNFHKEGTTKYLMQINLSQKEQKSYRTEKKLNLIIEIDTNPPIAHETEVRQYPLPTPFAIKTFTQPSIFSGKIHTLLCRSKKLKTRGQDWYDFAWLVSLNTPLHLSYLEARMKQSKHLKVSQELKAKVIKKALLKRAKNLDFNKSKEDILSFTKDQPIIEEWSPDLLFALIEDIRIIN